MFEEGHKPKNVLSVHFSAGSYSVNVFTTDKSLSYQELMDYAIEKIVQLSTKIDVSKQPLQIDNDVV